MRLNNALLSLLLASCATFANAQTYRIGVLWAGMPRDGVDQSFVGQLRALGYEEGKNLIIDSLYAEWKPARFPEMAQEIVRRKPDLIFAPTGGAAAAAKNATRTVPIVFAIVPDPVGQGLVASLARPGGNLTGSSNVQTGLTRKRMQLLREALPGLTRTGLIYDPADQVALDQASEARKAAAELNVRLHEHKANRPEDFEKAFDALTRERAQAVFITGSLTSYNQARRIAELALKHQLPTMTADSKYVEEGALMSYGVSIPALYAKAATYVDRILKGTKAAELPVEQADRFEMLINTRTAEALGLSVPQTVILRADRVIQ